MLVHAGIKFKATREDALALFHRGGRALARVEANGVKIDTKYLNRTRKDTAKEVEDRSKKLLDHKDVIKPWKRRFGHKFNIGSGDQIGMVFFKDLGFPDGGKTATGKFKTDEKTLRKIQHPFIEDYFEIKDLQSDLRTFLNGIAEELTPDGFIHPNQNLNLARTYRSSNDSPNFQALPVRKPKRARRIRQCIVSRFKNGRIVDRDFKAAEVFVALCYHKDPTMYKYLKEGRDLHLDMAAQIYKCPADLVSKKARYCAKNMFVFPQFYGDYYIHCATNLWEAIDAHKLSVNAGEDIPMREWLRQWHIKKLGKCDPEQSPRAGTFEYHLKRIEDHFWNKRFPVYTAWKRRWYEAYKDTGIIPFFTGFVVDSIHSRNDVINYPVQGAAFHCLLWCLIETVKALRKYKMKSVVMAQIHDSMIGDCPDDEVQDYLDITEEIVTVKLTKAFDWLILPIGTEVEVTPAGASWADKSEWRKNKKGLWCPAE